MIGQETRPGRGKTASAAIQSLRPQTIYRLQAVVLRAGRLTKLGFLQYVSGMLAAFVRPAPILAFHESRRKATGPATRPEMTGVELALTGDLSGPSLRTSIRREPRPNNRIMAPRVFAAGPTRRSGLALIGGSLEARLSHMPAGRGRDTGAKMP